MKLTSRIVVGSLLALSITASAHAAKKITPETIKEDLIAARCKAEAKKYYSVIKLKKRRQFEKDCIDRARR
jgi:hypothetical protein